MVKQSHQHQFFNRLRILRSLDPHEVPGLEDIRKFISSPYEYSIRCRDQDADEIFAAIKKRGG